MSNMHAMAREIEQSPKAAGGDRDIHNLSHVYQELASLQSRDGGPQSQAFQRDLGQLNHQLQQDGVLPNLQITGIDSNNHILTKNAQTGEAASQAANNVYDYGQQSRQAAAPDSPLGMMANPFAQQNRDGSYGSPADNTGATPSSPLNMLANAFGISQNRDGSYSSPADNAGAATGGILQTIMSGMLGGGSGSSQQTDANGDSIPTPPTAPGLNPIMAQAWSGWGDASPDDPPPDA